MTDTGNRITGTKDLIFDAIEETANLVEQMHRLAARTTFRPLALIEPLSTLSQAVKGVHDTTASGVYFMIRTVNRGVQKLLDTGTGLVVSGLSQTSETQKNQDKISPQQHQSSTLSPKHLLPTTLLIEQSEAILNGLYGDYLSKKNNPLDLKMRFRLGGNILPLEKTAMAQAFPDATGKICIFVHGLMCTEHSWNIGSEKFYNDPSMNFASQLKTDLGYTPLFVRYNTGRHISENGRAFSDMLSRLMDCYPEDIEEIVLAGHSMGGLVSRSAAHYGHKENAAWTQKLKHIFCIGSPNLGAPLEKAVNLLSSLLHAFAVPGTRAPAQVLKSRSDGIKDLRFGYTIDDEWMDKNPDALLQNHRHNLPLVETVGYYFVAATVTADPNHPLGLLIGDIMVRVPSAAGRHRSDPEKSIPFRSGLVFSGMNHLHMANHPDVYKVIRQILSKAEVSRKIAGGGRPCQKNQDQQ